MSGKQGQPEGAHVRLPPPLVFAGFVLLGVVFQYAIAPFPVPVPRSARLVGAFLLALVGLGLGFAAFGLFRKSGQDPRPWTPSPTLLAEGPYRFSRNPMYVSMVLLQASLGLAFDNVWVIALAIPALIVVHFTAVRPEERYLVEHFGDAYRSYMTTVRRYL